MFLKTCQVTLCLLQKYQTIMGEGREEKKKKCICRVNNVTCKKKKKKMWAEVQLTVGTTVNAMTGANGGRVQWRGVKWRGCGDPWIHIVKSDSLSPPDKSPLDKCGQAAEEPASAAMGCRTAIRMKLYWANQRAEWGGPRQRNSANSKAHSSSCRLNLLKNLHIGIHHTQQI